ncbi:uncharacterized protein P174DRAFT_373839 [Aspergillus novofumigatus IBT 16806]|uniref:DUF6594 domain-containing protein n=1 Tax=Aspergillus novofumigatus (strain IBT 16806) TaxID=1392255 RepID=A0A2I1C3H7_ASPN1|nr:uncharacterized protein P174DRAFT_373839 [Aspergillus novofumigatus IBT 16806]PKX92165.1 hypothetical protein P174DRAFT_373839 [Aspergillus novofumigatus IBT 16806]
MPLYSSSSRSKKSNRSSAGSVLSMTSRTTSKGSKSSVEKKEKKEHAQVQPGAHKDDEPSRNYAQKTQGGLNSTRNSTDPDKKAPNVFEYLDADESSDNGSSSSDAEENVSEPSGQPSNVLETYPKHTYPGLNTDARTNTLSQGLAHRQTSIRSQASSLKSKRSANSRQLPQVDVSPSTVPLHLPRNTGDRKLSLEEIYNIPGALTDSPNPTGNLNLDLATLPETYYPPRNSSTSHRPPLPPSPPRSPKEDLHRTGRKARRGTKLSHIPCGYGILSSRLSSSSDSKEPSLPPLYRRFEDLNHRVLLYLQDEIAQMEEDLRILDEYEEMHRVATAEREGTKKLPASRRMDAQAQVYSSLHYRRVEVMGALIHKTEQYTYSRVLQTIPSASDKDIETYRTWMKDHSPIITAESRFLDHGKDLISLSPRRASPTASVYSAIIIASAAILLPLLAFSMISEFSGRLLVVALVGGAAAAIAMNYSSGAEHLESRDGWRSATLYVSDLAHPLSISSLFCL